MQITSAMKMVSAAKLKRAQDAITRLRPYASKLRYILENVSSSLDLSENMYAEDRGQERVLIVAITSNRGLCGGFNSNIIKRVNVLIKKDLRNCHRFVTSSKSKKRNPRPLSSVLKTLSKENKKRKVEK